jgi:hypothetical protein
MPPEPTIPKPPATLSAVSGPWVMTPLFCVPDHSGTDAPPPRPSSRRATTPLRAPRRTAPRRTTVRAKSGRRAAAPADGQDAVDLLTLTAERLRQALWRSFLRYGIPGDLDSAVHAAMNVIEPVLLARDTEIQQLLRRIPATAAAGASTGSRSPRARSTGSRSATPRTTATTPAAAKAGSL